MEKILYIIVGFVAIIATYLFGKRNGHDNGATSKRVDESISGAINGVNDARQNATDVVGAVTTVQGDLSKVDDGLTKSENRLNDSTERLDKLTETIEVSRKQNDSVTERSERIADIVQELQDRGKEQ